MRSVGERIPGLFRCVEHRRHVSKNKEFRRVAGTPCLAPGERDDGGSKQDALLVRYTRAATRRAKRPSLPDTTVPTLARDPPG